MSKWIPTSLVVIVIAGFVALFAASGDNQASGDAKKAEVYKPVAPIDVVMDMVSDNFDEALDQLKAKKWSKVRKAALMSAEALNVLQYHSSEEVKKEDMGKWKKISAQIRDDLVKVGAAAKKKDAATVKKLLDTVEETCETCHDMRE